MLASFFQMFTSDDFMPHGMCFLWRPELIWLHAISDTLIALAYYSIPLVLVYFVWRRKDLVFRSVFVLFGVFILACGTTHVMGVWTLWNPDYAIDGIVKVVTAVSSLGTLAFLWKVVPQALALPSPAQWQAANRNLQAEIADRRAAEDSVRRLNTELEDRVRARTADLEEANRRLAASLREKEILLQEVHHRVKNNLQVISGLLTIQGRAIGPELSAHFDETLRRIRTMSRVHEQLYKSADAASFDMAHYLNALCSGLSELYGAPASKVTCHVHAGPLTVDLNTAMPLVLIVNEVLSNSFKHAFDSGDAGEIFIDIEPAENGQVLLTIKDTGTGLPADYAQRSERSMGMRLINNLSKQIGATARFVAGAGTTFALTLPQRAVAAVAA
jgi:two-component sensor histidine kinase